MRSRKGQPIKIYVLEQEKVGHFISDMFGCLFFSFFSVLIEENIYKKKDSKYLKKEKQSLMLERNGA